MTYELSEAEITKIAAAAVEMAIENLGLHKQQISTRKAYQLYGKTRVDSWRRSGKINPKKQGNIVFWDAKELKELSNQNHLWTKK